MECMEKYWAYEQCNDGQATKPCPSCGKKMVVEWDAGIMISSPPQRRWYWWCGCGRREVAGIHVCREPKMPSLHDKWEDVNAKN